ncbi:uncharacterized protein FFMR_15838 [Fusarium fujikuroi]|nr:uncharacterized protein FFMR_15838 [Fusarium fujikuroi]
MTRAWLMAWKRIVVSRVDAPRFAFLHRRSDQVATQAVCMRPEWLGNQEAVPFTAKRVDIVYDGKDDLHG